MRTYQAHPRGLMALFQETYSCVRKYVSGSPDSRIREVLRTRDEAVRRIRETYGSTWENCRLIEIGCGQKCTWSVAFGMANSVTGIDLDEVVRGFDLLAYARMLQFNGAYRFAKTVSRKATCADWREWHAFRRAIGPKAKWPYTLRMDAQTLRFEDGTFDGGFSFHVFEHLPDAALALREMRRVVRPSGVIYIVLEPFTSITGAHDPRLWSDMRTLPLWAHLRRSCAGISSPGVFVNQLGLGDFERIALTELKDVKFYYEEDVSRVLLAQLTPTERHELSSFSDQELCTRYLTIIGRA